MPRMSRNLCKSWNCNYFLGYRILEQSPYCNSDSIVRTVASSLSLISKLHFNEVSAEFNLKLDTKVMRHVPFLKPKLTKASAILISPRMWLGCYSFCLYPKLHHSGSTKHSRMNLWLVQGRSIVSSQLCKCTLVELLSNHQRSHLNVCIAVCWHVTYSIMM